MTTPIWPAVRADLLDCLQANLAVLADAAHGHGTHRRLGATLRLRRTVTADGLPSAEPTLDDQLADAREQLGLAVTRRVSDVPTAELGAFLRPDGPTYLVADAHDLPWTPYAGRRHMAHSFLVVPDGPDGGPTVLDAYHNDTPWGRARPLSLPFDADVVTATHVDEVLWLDPTALRQAPTPRVEELDPESVAAFLAPYRAALAGPDAATALERLVLESWLLQRSRGLHTVYRDPDGVTEPTEHLLEWARTTEQLYVAMRRVQRGAVPPAGVLDRFGRVLGADAGVFAAAPGPGAGAAPEHRAAPSPAAARTADPRWPGFARFVAETLDISVEALATTTSLADVPTAGSLRIVEIVEGLESRFGARFGEDDLVPERLYDLDHLLAIVPRPVEVPA